MTKVQDDEKRKNGNRIFEDEKGGDLIDDTNAAEEIFFICFFG